MIRTGVVGLGHWGAKLVRNVQASPRLSLEAMCDVDADALERAHRAIPAARATTDYEAFLDGLDAVIVATPLATHHDLALAALDRGLHVLVEKPLADTYKRCLALVERARSRGVVLAVDHTFLYSGAVRKMRALVEEGDLGTVWYYDSVRLNIGMMRHDANVIWDLASHDLYIADYLFGRLPESITVHGATHAPTPYCDQAYVHCSFGNGLVASFHVNWLSPVKTRRILLGGSARTVVFDDMDPLEKLRIYDGAIQPDPLRNAVEEANVEYRVGDIFLPRIDETEPLTVMLRAFADAVDAGRPLPSDGEAGSRIVHLLETCDRSLKAGGAAMSPAPGREATTLRSAAR